jgi:GNAT superfamily N-acetyltransferase
LDLYENAFPQEERIHVSYILQILRAVEEGRPVSEQLLAALNGGGSLQGLIFTNHSTALRSMALYYFAVVPEQRSRGLGAQVYQEVLQRCRDANCRMLVFDLEDPEFCPAPEARDLAQRRIGFYIRQGARVLEGARSTLRMFPTLPEAHLRVMVHPLEPVTPTEVLTAARELLSESVEQVGPLKLTKPIG